LNTAREQTFPTQPSQLLTDRSNNPIYYQILAQNALSDSKPYKLNSSQQKNRIDHEIFENSMIESRENTIEESKGNITRTSLATRNSQVGSKINKSELKLPLYKLSSSSINKSPKY